MLYMSRNGFRAHNGIIKMNARECFLRGAAVFVGYVLCTLLLYYICTTTSFDNLFEGVHNASQGLSTHESIEYWSDDALPPAFKMALDDYAALPPDDVKIVLLVAYYRSGSTFVEPSRVSASQPFPC
ncbi:uncharacterized protein LOC144169200 [Haemaphysalis longicornis]